MSALSCADVGASLPGALLAATENVSSTIGGKATLVNCVEPHMERSNLVG